MGGCRYATTTQRENSDVSPNPPAAGTTVAVATTTVPVGVEIGGTVTFGTAAVPEFPFAFVVTVAAPRNVAPSPKSAGAAASQAGLAKNSTRYVVAARVLNRQLNNGGGVASAVVGAGPSRCTRRGPGRRYRR
jgi:hypothetical protein